MSEVTLTDKPRPTSLLKPRVVFAGDHPGTRRPLSEHFAKLFEVYRKSFCLEGRPVTPDVLALFEAMRDTLAEAERRAG